MSSLVRRAEQLRLLLVLTFAWTYRLRMSPMVRVTAGLSTQLSAQCVPHKHEDLSRVPEHVRRENPAAQPTSEFSAREGPHLKELPGCSGPGSRNMRGPASNTR